MPTRTGQGHQVDDLWSPSTNTPDYEHSPSPAEILYENDSHLVAVRHPFDTPFISLSVASGRSQAPSTVRHAKSVWHRQHQTHPKCAEGQVIQLSNTCVWNVLEFASKSKQGGPNSCVSTPVLSQSSRLVSLAEQVYKNTRHHTPQPPC